jgi:hypothetical protein
MLVQNVARAAAAASLIFLVTFALAHLICILARIRKPGHTGFMCPGGPSCRVLDSSPVWHWPYSRGPSSRPQGLFRGPG